MSFLFFSKESTDRSGHRSAGGKEFQIAADDWLKLRAPIRVVRNLAAAWSPRAEQTEGADDGIS